MMCWAQDWQKSKGCSDWGYLWLATGQQWCSSGLDPRACAVQDVYQQSGESLNGERSSWRLVLQEGLLGCWLAAVQQEPAVCLGTEKANLNMAEMDLILY